MLQNSVREYNLLRIIGSKIEGEEGRVNLRISVTELPTSH